MFHHHMDRQVLDALHLGALGLPKTPWKHGILNNASDDARQKIADRLKDIGHPLDTRRKDDNRSRSQKWFAGERWLTFCAGQRGSSGGPQEIAKIVKIIADDLEARGVDRGAGLPTIPEEPSPAEEAVGKGNGASANGSTGGSKGSQGKQGKRGALHSRSA